MPVALYPERMKTVDNEIRDLALKFIEKAKTDNKPFFCWLNPTRMHIVTHLSDKYEKMRNSENGWSEEEAGMAQLDDDIGLVMQKLKDIGVGRQHHRRLHHRQRHRTLHLARWRSDTVRAEQRDRYGRRLSRAVHPAVARPRPG